jgi:hypothetical protein
MSIGVGVGVADGLVEEALDDAPEELDDALVVLDE